MSGFSPGSLYGYRNFFFPPLNWMHKYNFSLEISKTHNFFCSWLLQGSQQDKHSKIVALVSSEVQNSHFCSLNSCLIVDKTNIIQNTVKNKS